MNLRSVYILFFCALALLVYGEGGRKPSPAVTAGLAAIYDHIDGIRSSFSVTADASVDLSAMLGLTGYVQFDTSIGRYARGSIVAILKPGDAWNLRFGYVHADYFPLNVREYNTYAILRILHGGGASRGMELEGGVNLRSFGNLSESTMEKGGFPIWRIGWRFSPFRFNTLLISAGNMGIMDVLSAGYFQLRIDHVVGIGEHLKLSLAGGLGFAGTPAMAGIPNRFWAGMTGTYAVAF